MSTDVETKRLFDRVIWPAIQALRPRAVSLTKSQANADDLLADVALRAWRYLPSYMTEDDRRRAAGEVSNPSAWVGRILATQAIDAWHKRRRTEAVSYVDELWSDGTSDNTLAEHLDRDATLAEVREAIDRIPAQFALVMRLRFALEGGLPLGADGGVPYSVIAEAAGIPIGTVMSRLYRGIRMVRAILDGAEVQAEPTAESEQLALDFDQAA